MRFFLKITNRHLVLLLKQKKQMGILRQIAEYLYIKKRDPKAPHSKWIGYMHGINRLSLLMFVAALIFMLVRFIFFRK
jgi:hypothetical protein